MRRWREARAHRKRSAVRGSGAIALGVSFLGMGLAALVYSGLCWKTYLESAFWKQVPARIERVEFGTRTIGIVKCRYSYEFRGRKYRGTRVGVMGGTSSESDIHARRYHVLKQYKDKAEPYPALVDPECPRRALLFRETSPFMHVFPPLGVVFAAAGAGLVGVGTWWVAKRRKRRELTHELGGRPWLFREDWSQMCVHASNARELAVAWALGIGLPLFACTLLLSVHLVPVWAKVIIWILAALAVAAFAEAILRTVRQLVHGTPLLALTELPVVPGRRMVAAVETRGPVGLKQVALVLSCVEMRGGDDAYLEELYKETLPVDAAGMRTDPDKTLIPVVIDIPAHLPDRRHEPGLQIAWKLKLKARTFPVPLRVSFDLPVFRVDESEIRKRGA